MAHWQQSLLPLSLERRAGRMVMQWVHPAKGGSNGLEIDVSPGNHASVVRSDAFLPQIHPRRPSAPGEASRFCARSHLSPKRKASCPSLVCANEAVTECVQ